MIVTGLMTVVLTGVMNGKPRRMMTLVWWMIVRVLSTGGPFTWMTRTSGCWLENPSSHAAVPVRVRAITEPPATIMLFRLNTPIMAHLCRDRSIAAAI